MGGTQPDSTEIKSGLLPRFPGRRACEVNLRLSCFVVWLVVVRTGVWTAQAIGHLHVWIMIRVRGNAGYSSLCKRFDFKGVAFWARVSISAKNPAYRIYR